MRRAILLAPLCILPPLIQCGSTTLGDDDPTAAPATQIETPAGRVTVTPAPGGSVEAALKSALQSWAEQNVPHWIEQLSSADFRERRHAADALFAVGLPAVGPLEKAANGDDTEAALGALNILTELLGSRESAISNAAYEALRRLAKSTNARVATRVPKTLERIGRSRLEALGAEVFFNEPDSTYRIKLDQKWVGGDAGLERLSDLPAVAQLDIGHYDVTDAGLDHLRELEHLRELRLSFAAISVDGLAKLVNCPALEDLAVPAHVATDEGLQIIARLPHITRLELTNAHGFDGHGLRHLAGHPSLASLNLYGTSTTAENLTWLLEIPHLRELQTPQSAMTDEGMEVIGKLTQLTSLSVSNTSVTDAGLIHLRNLKSLTFLNLSQNGITDVVLGYLSEHSALTRMALWDTYITRSAAEELMTRIPGLKGLSTDRLLDAPLPAESLQALRAIQALGGKVTPSHHTQETWVWLGPEWKGRDSDLQQLSRLPKLTEVGLGYPATDAAIPHLELLSGLKRIYLNNTQISESGVERLSTALPKARITVTPDVP